MQWRHGVSRACQVLPKSRAKPRRKSKGPARRGRPALHELNTHACSVAFDRPRLSSRSCAAVKAHPQVPHLQLVNALVTRLGPSLVVWGWLARTARTNSPPHCEHSRFCIALVRKRVAQASASVHCSTMAQISANNWSMLTALGFAPLRPLTKCRV